MKRCTWVHGILRGDVHIICVFDAGNNQLHRDIVRFGLSIKVTNRELVSPTKEEHHTLEPTLNDLIDVFARDTDDMLLIGVTNTRAHRQRDSNTVAVDIASSLHDNSDNWLRIQYKLAIHGRQWVVG